MSKDFSIIDSHCHLDRFYNKGELPEVIGQAQEAGVDRMIPVGTSYEDWSLYAQLNQEHRGLIDYTVGLHPCHVEEDW